MRAPKPTKAETAHVREQLERIADNCDELAVQLRWAAQVVSNRRLRLRLRKMAKILTGAGVD